MRLLKLLTLWPPFQIAGEELGEPPDVPGVEYTLGLQRTHAKLSATRAHYKLPIGRTQYTVPEE